MTKDFEFVTDHGKNDPTLTLKGSPSLSTKVYSFRTQKKVAVVTRRK